MAAQSEQVQKAMQAVQGYREGFKKLQADGTLPDMTAFDLATQFPFAQGATGKSDMVRMVDEALASGPHVAFERLPGPWQAAKTKEEKIAVLVERLKANIQGRDIFLHAQWQLQYGDAGLGSNIVSPTLRTTGMGASSETKLSPGVIIADPADAERISRVHVRKEGNFEPVLYDGVISTTDNDLWRIQREHMVEVFLPVSSLAQIMPVSLQRAKQCAQRLADATVGAGGKAQPVDMSDFLLHEAQAQLQLALMGVPEAQMDELNSDIRRVFAGDSTVRRGALAAAAKALMERAKTDDALALPTDGRPVQGPLFRSLQTSPMSPTVDYGNLLLFLFAGHDTTGHTMTWFLFEVARHPEIQRALQAEVDAFFDFLGGRDPTYQDLGAERLTLLDRCVTETLRLWPAVASGTYRQLQFDDAVRGPGGSQVMLPKGTPVQISNWSRHRNPAVWGPDADIFNPYREFKEEEMARVGCPMAAANPQSERFSPFAHKPRNCLGRNFAQLEMRLILTNLLRRFEFSLAEPFDQLMGASFGATPKRGEFSGVNRGTMGPMDLRKDTHRMSTYGLLMHATAR